MWDIIPEIKFIIDSMFLVVRLAWLTANRWKSYLYPKRRENVDEDKGVRRKQIAPLKKLSTKGSNLPNEESEGSPSRVFHLNESESS